MKQPLAQARFSPAATPLALPPDRRFAHSPIRRFLKSRPIFGNCSFQFRDENQGTANVDFVGSENF
jgi:hypothetical protein